MYGVSVCVYNIHVHTCTLCMESVCVIHVHTCTLCMELVCVYITYTYTYTYLMYGVSVCEYNIHVPYV